MEDEDEAGGLRLIYLQAVQRQRQSRRLNEGNLAAVTAQTLVTVTAQHQYRVSNDIYHEVNSHNRVTS